MSTKFERAKKQSGAFLSCAADDTTEVNSIQAHGVYKLLAHLRAECYHNSDTVVIDPAIINEFDAAVKRLFS